MIVADYIDPDLAAGADIEIDEYSYVKTVERRDIWFSLGIGDITQVVSYGKFSTPGRYTVSAFAHLNN